MAGIGKDGEPGGSSTPSVEEQKSTLEDLLIENLELGNAWYLIDRTWFNALKVYLGMGLEPNTPWNPIHPGPVDNTRLLDENNQVMTGLIEGFTHKLVPSSVWNYVTKLYGLKAEHHTIVRKVINAATVPKKHLIIEIFKANITLYDNFELKNPRIVALSRGDTVAKVEEVCRQVFNVPSDHSVRLTKYWGPDHKYLLKDPASTIYSEYLDRHHAIVMETQVVTSPVTSPEFKRKESQAVSLPVLVDKPEDKHEETQMVCSPVSSPDKRKNTRMVSSSVPIEKPEDKHEETQMVCSPVSSPDKRKNTRMVSSPVPIEKPEDKHEETQMVCSPVSSPDKRKNTRMVSSPVPIEKPEDKQKDTQIVSSPVLVAKPEDKHEETQMVCSPVNSPDKQKDTQMVSSPVLVAKPEDKHEETQMVCSPVSSPDKQKDTQIVSSPVLVAKPEDKHEETQMVCSPVSSPDKRKNKRMVSSPVPIEKPQDKHEETQMVCSSVNSPDKQKDTQIVSSPVLVDKPEDKHEETQMVCSSVSSPDKQKDTQIVSSPVLVDKPEDKHEETQMVCSSVNSPDKQKDTQIVSSPVLVDKPEDKHEETQMVCSSVSSPDKQKDTQIVSSPVLVDKPEDKHEETQMVCSSVNSPDKQKDTQIVSSPVNTPEIEHKESKMVCSPVNSPEAKRKVAQVCTPENPPEVMHKEALVCSPVISATVNRQKSQELTASTSAYRRRQVALPATASLPSIPVLSALPKAASQHRRSSKNVRGELHRCHSSVSAMVTRQSINLGHCCMYGTAEGRGPAGQGPGLIGLANIGNTCFFNSILQCLNNCEPLVRYFLDDIYMTEHNVKVTNILEPFADLIKLMWSSRHAIAIPSYLKARLSLCSPYFSHNQQHDAHELLTFLLDGLHEDVNRIKIRPKYSELDSSKADDTTLALRVWTSFKKYNDSIIVDNFYGLLKSTLYCNSCERISVKFDTFSILSLPLPANKDRLMKVIFVPYDQTKSVAGLSVGVPPFGTVGDLAVGLEELTMVHTEDQIICEIKDSHFHIFFDFPDQLEDINDSARIYMFELPPLHKRCDTVLVPVYLWDIELTGKHGSLKANFSRNLFGTPFVVLLPVGDIAVAEIYRCILQRMIRDWSAYFYSITNLQNYPEDMSSIKPSGETFFTVVLVQIKNYAVEELDKGGKHTVPSYFGHTVLCLQMGKNKRQFYCPSNMLDYGDEKEEIVEPPQELSILDCLNIFTSEEVLGGTEAWNCPSCKVKSRATKKLDIWELPNILIFHLKRFAYGPPYPQKLNHPVTYPVENLDLTSRVVNPKKKKIIYDLVAVSNHFGGLSSGHYNAICKNNCRGWFTFDDSDISPATEEQVQSQDAYILFYQRRPNQNDEPTDDQNKDPTDGQNKEPTDDKNKEPTDGQNKAPTDGQNKELADDQNKEPTDGQNKEPIDDQNKEPIDDQNKEPTDHQNDKPAVDTDGVENQ